MDDHGFLYRSKKNRGQKWVARIPNKLCQCLWRKIYISEYCPNACDTYKSQDDEKSLIEDEGKYSQDENEDKESDQEPNDNQDKDKGKKPMDNVMMRTTR